MKTAIYVEDGVVQLVITPTTEFEKNALSGFTDKPLAIKIFEGTFYDCRGGWTRQNDYYPSSMYGRNDTDKSIILRVESSNAAPRSSTEEK